MGTRGKNNLSSSLVSCTLNQLTATMTRTLRVAILECDTPIDPVRAQFGTYRDIFEKFLHEGVKNSGNDVALHCSKWHVVENPVFPEPDDFDALLLTGSSRSIPMCSRWFISANIQKSMMPIRIFRG